MATGNHELAALDITELIIRNCAFQPTVEEYAILEHRIALLEREERSDLAERIFRELHAATLHAITREAHVLAVRRYPIARVNLRRAEVLFADGGKFLADACPNREIGDLVAPGGDGLHARASLAELVEQSADGIRTGLRRNLLWYRLFCYWFFCLRFRRWYWRMLGNRGSNEREQHDAEHYPYPRVMHRYRARLCHVRIEKPHYLNFLP